MSRIMGCRNTLIARKLLLSPFEGGGGGGSFIVKIVSLCIEVPHDLSWDNFLQKSSGQPGLQLPGHSLLYQGIEGTFLAFWTLFTLWKVLSQLRGHSLLYQRIEGNLPASWTLSTLPGKRK